MARDYTFDLLDYNEPVAKVFFVRHGETKANKNGLIFGRWDLPLNKEGIKQAKNVAEKLKKICSKENIDVIFSSPLKRAKQTAKAISKKTGIKKIVVDKNLIEKSEGLWQKMTYWDLKEVDPLNFRKWIKDPYRSIPPKGESVINLMKRVKIFQSKVLKLYRGKSIIVVTHSGPIRAFILNILKLPPDNFWCFKTETGAITEIRISKKHVMIWGLNR